MGKLFTSEMTFCLFSQLKGLTKISPQMSKAFPSSRQRLIHGILHCFIHVILLSVRLRRFFIIHFY